MLFRQISSRTRRRANPPSSIHAPLSCTIIAANEAVERDAALVVRDPYGAGWLFRILPTALEIERTLLLDAITYRAWLAPRLDRFKPPIDDEDRSNFGQFY